MTPGIGSSKTPATVSAGERGGNFCTDMKEMPDGEKSFDELAKSKKSLAFKSRKTERCWGGAALHQYDGGLQGQKNQQ